MDTQVIEQAPEGMDAAEQAAVEAATDAAVETLVKPARANGKSATVRLTGPAKTPKGVVVKERASGAAQRAAGVKPKAEAKVESKPPSAKEQREALATSLETLADGQIDLGNQMAAVLRGAAKALRAGRPVTEEPHKLAYDRLCAAGRTRIATVKRAVIASRAK